MERTAWWLAVTAGVITVGALIACVSVRNAGAVLGMRFNSALCVACLATAIGLTLRARAADPSAPSPPAARVLALFVALLAAATASQDLFGIDLGIDQMVVANGSAGAAGRMSLNSSVLFTLLGVGLVAGYRRPSAWFQTPILAASAIVLLSAAGYALGVSELFAVARDTAIAPATVIVSGCVCVASLALYPHYGFTGLVLEQGPGSFTIRRLLPMIIGAPLLLGWLARLGARAGFYDDAFSVAINVVVATAALVIVLVHSARNVNRINSEVQTLNQELALRADLLEMSNRELEAFSYSVSHDLRAPIRHIGGFADLLRKRATGQLDEKSQHYMNTINDAARRAGTLIDDLLAFSRMSRSKMAVADLDIESIVGRVWKQLAPDREGREVTIEIGALPHAVGDASMIELVFTNLLGNALKYSRRAKPARIEVGGARVGTDVEYWVRDNGVGFDMTYADKLFGVFQRLHSADDFEGVGIGLANVKRIIARHGGRVWADGEVGKGATFHFSLPVNRVERMT